MGVQLKQNGTLRKKGVWAADKKSMPVSMAATVATFHLPSEGMDEAITLHSSPYFIFYQHFRGRYSLYPDAKATVPTEIKLPRAV